MFDSGENYVCDYETHQVLFGPMTSKAAVDFILSQGDLKAQSRFCNMSRYQLEKRKIYPRNAAGNEKLQLDLQAAQPGAAPDRLQSASLPFSGR